MYSLLFLLLFLAGCNNENKTIDDKSLTIKDIEIFYETPAWELMEAIKSSNFYKVRSLLDENRSLANVSSPKFDITPIFWSIRTDRYKATKLLLDYGANPNYQSKIVGSNPLFATISHLWDDIDVDEDSRFVKLLLDNGADPNSIYWAPKEKGTSNSIECGTSALSYAVTRGFDKVKLLVKAGADINYKSPSGETATIVALTMEKIDIAYYLIAEQNASIVDPYYFYSFDDDKLELNDPRYPVDLLRYWVLDLDSKEYKVKMEIIKEFKRQGIDYSNTKPEERILEYIKKLFPKNWMEYLKRY